MRPARERCTAAVACTATPWPRPCARRVKTACWRRLYTPIRTDEENVGIDRVCAGRDQRLLATALGVVSSYAVGVRPPAGLAPVAPLGHGPQRQRASGTSRPVGGLDARRGAGPAAEGSRETGAMAESRHPAGHRTPEQRPLDRRRPADHPPAGRARRVQSVGRRQFSGKAPRAASQPGPRRVAAASGRSGRAGGDERLLCRRSWPSTCACRRRGLAWFRRG